MSGGVRPMGDRVLVDRIDETDGRERMSGGGIILPAKDMTLKRGRSRDIPDTYRAIVVAVGPDARDHLAEGDEVLVHTYDQRPDQTIAGEQTRYGLLVRLADVLGVLEADTACAAPNHSPACMALLDRLDDERERDLNTLPITGLIPKGAEFAPPRHYGVLHIEGNALRTVPKEPESVNDLGYHLAAKEPPEENLKTRERERIKAAIDAGFRRPIPIPPEAVSYVPDDVISYFGERKCGRDECSKPNGHEDDCDDAARELRVVREINVQTARVKL